MFVACWAVPFLEDIHTTQTYSHHIKENVVDHTSEKWACGSPIFTIAQQFQRISLLD